MGDNFGVYVLAWALVWAGLCMLLAPRKGFTLGGGVALGVVLSVFGLIYMLIRKDDPVGTDRGTFWIVPVVAGVALILVASGFIA